MITQTEAATEYQDMRADQKKLWEIMALIKSGVSGETPSAEVYELAQFVYDSPTSTYV